MAWAARRGPARRAGNNSNPMGAFAPRLGLVNALSIPRGATRSGLPPYGLSEVLRLAPADRHGLLLLEGLIDVHNLRSDGFPNVAAVGGARAQFNVVMRLRRLGFVLLCSPSTTNPWPRRRLESRRSDQPVERRAVSPCGRARTPRRRKGSRRVRPGARDDAISCDRRRS